MRLCCAFGSSRHAPLLSPVVIGLLDGRRMPPAAKSGDVVSLGLALCNLPCHLLANPDVVFAILARDMMPRRVSDLDVLFLSDATVFDAASFGRIGGERLERCFGVGAIKNRRDDHRLR